MRSELWELARRLYTPHQTAYNTTCQLLSGPRGEPTCPGTESSHESSQAGVLPTQRLSGHPAIETPWTVRPRWLTATGRSSPSAVYSLDYLSKSPGL